MRNSHFSFHFFIRVLTKHPSLRTVELVEDKQSSSPGSGRHGGGAGGGWIAGLTDPIGERSEKSKKKIFNRILDISIR